MSDIGNRLLALITERPGQLARELGPQVSLDKKEVNSLLYGELRGRIRQDANYRWFPLSGATPDSKPVREECSTPLATLCRYYLDCLSQDDTDGFSTFAASKFDLDYAPFTRCPLSDPGALEEIFELDSARKLISKIRRDRSRQVLMVGYPIRLNKIRSKKGWEGFVVEPVFVQSLQEDGRGVLPRLAEGLPQINFKVVRGQASSQDGGVLEEAVQLSNELGLDAAPGFAPDLDELPQRLRAIRPDWDWKEDPDPYALSAGPALSEITEPGIYNRAILFVAERSPFTKGLETELSKLQAIDPDSYSATALGQWMSGIPAVTKDSANEVLLEVLPLNNEQRQAIRQGLSQSLTVITGPPGTGKSQVVTSLLINASWRGKRVLFASKNNKAVDVVEQRVNGIGCRPVLLRMGANECQSQLASYLTTLLAATATQHDHNEYQDALKRHELLVQQNGAVIAQLDIAIALRNSIDKKEQAMEVLRAVFSGERFSSLRNASLVDIGNVVEKFIKAIEAANRSSQSSLTRLFWPLLRKKRFRNVESSASAFSLYADVLSVFMPKDAVSDTNIKTWISTAAAASERIQAANQVNAYFSEIDALRESLSIEEGSRKILTLAKDVAENSTRLWEAWLRLLPARMSVSERKLLGEYCSILNLVIGASEAGGPGRDVFRRYYQLFPKITSILPCWAVTALSANGRIPLEPGFFDLVVIDEASQCDIASALPLLYRAKAAVIIGDPKQLNHISALTARQDQQLLEKHGLVEKAINWNFATNSLFDLASRVCRGEDIVVLRDHHRSHADIINFSNEHFYEGRLRVATNYDRLKRPMSNAPSVRWVNVRGAVTIPAGGGSSNAIEADALLLELRRILIEQRYKGSVGVVSPFRAQANLIREKIARDEQLADACANADFLVDTVHRFQGDERDIMLFSPVISQGTGRGSLGFLRSNPQLFNVAITRARAALIVVGDQVAALDCDVSYLVKFAQYAAGRVQIQPAVCVEDAGPRYPKVSNPERVSEWEHVLYEALYSRGIKTIPQFDVDKYTLDLALIRGERRLDIEVDGERYHRNWDGELCRRDQIRNHRLIELGWDIRRFWVYQIRDDLEWCLDQIAVWEKNVVSSQ